MKLTVKHLVTYYDSISKKLNQKKCRLPHSSIFPDGRAPVKITWISTDMEIVSLLKDLGEKISCLFLWTLSGLGEGKGQRAKSGKLLSQSAKKVPSRILPPSFLCLFIQAPGAFQCISVWPVRGHQVWCGIGSFSPWGLPWGLCNCLWLGLKHHM